MGGCGASRPEGKQGPWLLVNPVTSFETCKGPAGSTECCARCPEGLRHCLAQSTVVLRQQVGPERFNFPWPHGEFVAQQCLGASELWFISCFCWLRFSIPFSSMQAS